MTDRDPRSELEEEGIPDLQDGYPEQYWAEDPQKAPVPGDRPVGVDDYGTTPEEERENEPLDGRLNREMPDPTQAADPVAAVAMDETSRETARLVQPDEGVHEDTESDEVADEVGQDAGGFTAEESAVRVEHEPGT